MSPWMLSWHFIWRVYVKLHSTLMISILFSRCKHVIAVDIDPQKIDCAQHNASVYAVNDQIDFVVGDFIRLAPHLKVMS
jgi:23S rRNA G2445 N2-methylase RlmL